MAALKFEMEDFADHEVTEKTFYVLRDFLQPNAAPTLESTAQTLLDLLPAEKTVGSDELMFFNNVCIDFAEQIPYCHPSQHKLAALMECLAGSAKLNVSHPTSYGGERMHWMGAELREVWAGMCWGPRTWWRSADSCPALKHQIAITPWLMSICGRSQLISMNVEFSAPTLIGLLSA